MIVIIIISSAAAAFATGYHLGRRVRPGAE